MAEKDASRKPTATYEQTALLLQGGGALGTYHYGVYEALAEAGHQPDWYAGTSIGGIQAAILAGNPPEQHIDKLNAFWERITWPQFMPVPPPDHPARKPINLAYAMGTMFLGQPGFFRPDPLATLLALPTAKHWDKPAGHYDFSPLERTLTELIDFDRINDGGPRLSLGAVEVETGQHVYFDSKHQRIDVRHVMACSALPPAFPAVEIDGYSYWDGGLLSNTPLGAVLEDNPRRSTLCFMVDLFDPNGDAPTDWAQLEDRRKDIIYASHSHEEIEAHRRKHEMRRAIATLYENLPEAKQQDPELARLSRLGCSTTMNIVHFVYAGQAYQSWAKDFTFLPQTLADHRKHGYEDTVRALADAPWEAPVPADIGIVHHEINTDKMPAGQANI